MVLESLVNPKRAEGRPWEMFFIGFVYSSVAIALSFLVFSGYESLVMITLTVITSVPLVHSLLRYEEIKDRAFDSERTLLKEHAKAATVLTFLFMGFVASFFSWYVLLPPQLSAQAFELQMNTLLDITIMPTGNFIGQMGTLSTIFLNNFKILLFCLLFSLFYGAGSIFILTWNASIMAVAIGSFVKTSITDNIYTLSHYLTLTSSGLLRYLVHGIPEILAYFIAGIAGGIISVAIIRHEFATKSFKRVLVDSIDLITIATIILFLAALVEVFITPLLF